MRYVHPDVVTPRPLSQALGIRGLSVGDLVAVLKHVLDEDGMNDAVQQMKWLLCIAKTLAVSTDSIKVGVRVSVRDCLIHRLAVSTFLI